MKSTIKKILREQTQCSFDWAKNLKYWGKTSGWRKGMIKTINRALKDVYSDMWERPTKKHMSSGGVVGYEVANGSTFGWSILNFFNAHRNVREALIDEYSKQYSWWASKKYKPCEFKIGEFLNWIFDERQTLFGQDTPMVKKLAALNHSTWNRGSKNEGEAVEYLTTLYGDSWGAEWDGEPGMFSDALTGVDIIMINKSSGEEHGYQAKPLVDAIMLDDNQWKIQSKGLYPYSTKTVKYYIFNTSGKDGVMIFRNTGEKPTIENGKEYMVFDTAPIAQTI
tara:strand:+ start:405 stop:1244 length:840 start_codon:yes stop_codon:yes gene_type:complete